MTPQEQKEIAMTSPALTYQSNEGGRANYPANFRGRVPLNRHHTLAEMVKGEEKIKLWRVENVNNTKGIKWHEFKEMIDFSFALKSISDCQDAWEAVSEQIEPTRPPEYLTTIN